MSEARMVMGLDPDTRNRDNKERARTHTSATAPNVQTPIIPEDDDLDTWTVADLKAEAAQQGISIPSRWRKADIVEALGG